MSRGKRDGLLAILRLWPGPTRSLSRLTLRDAAVAAADVACKAGTVVDPRSRAWSIALEWRPGAASRFGVVIDAEVEVRERLHRMRWGTASNEEIDAAPERRACDYDDDSDWRSL